MQRYDPTGSAAGNVSSCTEPNFATAGTVKRPDAACLTDIFGFKKCLKPLLPNAVKLLDLIDLPLKLFR